LTSAGLEEEVLRLFGGWGDTLAVSFSEGSVARERSPESAEGPALGGI